MVVESVPHKIKNVVVEIGEHYGWFKEEQAGQTGNSEECHKWRRKVALTRAAGWSWRGESTIACSWRSRGPNLWSSTDAIFSGGKWPSPANSNRVHSSNALMVMGQNKMITTVKPLTSSHPKCCVKVASQKGWPLMRGGHCAIIGTHVLVCVGRYAWFCVM